jgi:hypothetical protein
MAALLFLQHGLSKYFGFPQAMDPFPLFSLLWFAALIELAGGILVALGLFTRIAAFIMSGQMAVGYFLFTRRNRSFPSRIAAMRRSSTASCFFVLSFPARDRSASMRCCGKGGAERSAFVKARSNSHDAIQHLGVERLRSRSR